MRAPPKGGHLFQKGQSGNPGGRSKVIAELRDLARQHTADALNALVEIVNDKQASPTARVGAAEALLDRGYGRPTQTVEVRKSPLDDLDPATLAALAEALESGAEGIAGRNAKTTRH